MKKLLLIMAGAFALSAQCAQAQVVYDMSKVSCGEYMAMSPAAKRDFSAWMSGWYNQKRGVATVNLAVFHANVASVSKWCASNPNALIMSALDKSTKNAEKVTGGSVDINTAQITCKQLLHADADTQGVILGWMGGYFSSSKNRTRIDINNASHNEKAIGAFCKKKPKVLLMQAYSKKWK